VRGKLGEVVLTVTRPSVNQQLFYAAIPLGNLPRGQWVRVERDVTLPDSVTSLDVLTTYLWAAGSSEPIYLDDLTLAAIP